jgi:methylated-DNA-[protein]-cysteine S-methyltransferase
MTQRETELIAFLLGDVPRSPELAHWLATAKGRRELAAFRAALRSLRHLYGKRSLQHLYGRTDTPLDALAFYCAIHTPIGRVLVAATARGLVRVSFRSSESSFIEELQRRLSGGVIRSPVETAGIVTQLREYFAGKRRAFDVALDLRLSTPFQRRVLTAACRVPHGKLVSYGELARRIGQPGASRAVGQALGHNPIPIVIPCHRIIASGGGLGGYTGGLGIKKKLLGIEGVL